MRIDYRSRCSLPQRIQLKAIDMALGGYTSGPIVMMTYRREFFGKQMARCFQQAMREARHWSKGEVELFAAFVSRLVACQF